MAVKQITDLKINGTTFPYVQIKSPWKAGIVCYDDAGTVKEIHSTKVEEFIFAP